MPRSEKINLIKWNSDKFVSYLLHVFAEGVKNIFSNYNPAYLGRYKNIFSDVSASKKSMDKRLLFQFYKNQKVNDFSKSNLKYLKKIIVLCKRKNVELILLNTPLHPYYKNKIPSNYLERYEEVISQNKLVIIDFNEVVLSDSCFIPDGDHVSIRGALQVTNYLSEYEKNRTEISIVPD